MQYIGPILVNDGSFLSQSVFWNVSVSKHDSSGFKDTWYLWEKNGKNLQLLDILACNVLIVEDMCRYKFWEDTDCEKNALPIYITQIDALNWP